MREWRAQNRDKLRTYAHRNYVKYREVRRAQRHARYIRVKDRNYANSRRWLSQNRERYKAWLTEYRKRPDIIARHRARFLERKATNPNFALAQVLRVRIRNAIKNQSGSKASTSIALLGISIERVREHIETQFQPGMTWQNFGRDGWHLDHIIPCSSFDLRKPEHQRRCFHFSNLRPMWEKANLRKASTIEGELPLKYRLPPR